MGNHSDCTWFDQVPKIELHLHLEGAIPLETFQQLIDKYEPPAGRLSMAQLKERFDFRDFPHFLTTWSWKNQYLREYDDFALIAEETAKDLLRQNIRYVEMIFSPSTFLGQELTVQGITEAIRRGLNCVPGIEVGLVVDLVRDDGPSKAALTLSAASEVRDLGVLGINIGGTEHEFPPELFEPVYNKARRLGFYTSAHAGEGAGPASIWGAINSLEVDRIGHGTRAVEDERLMAHIQDNQIPIEVCPLSNVKTRVVDVIENHPVRRFFERGLAISINTDDPMMFGNSLADEYRALVDRCGFSRRDILSLIRGGIDTSWQLPQAKEALLSSFISSPAWRY